MSGIWYFARQAFSVSAEKIAAELAELLGLPHADYDLAVWRGRKGVWSPSIEPEDARLIIQPQAGVTELLEAPPYFENQ